jgi:alkanesulfonate monooxygenase SsuD/methylene tetrahydromethanopterin reductase-like flavin-dependent oxidoreductase (luciferase family)
MSDPNPIAAVSDTLRVGIMPPALTLEASARQRWLRSVADAGIDHVGTGDHVSFHSTVGMDGMVNATSILAGEPRLGAFIAIYLLLLRHPMTVARSISTMSELAPGRLTVGLGVGGEDPRELANCGVAMSERGRRMDESLWVLRRLLDGETVSLNGEFVTLDEARILPTPVPRVPLVVGGRSDAVLRRAGQLADGWLAIWVSPRRFADALAQIAGEAATVERTVDHWHHALNVWVGFDDDEARARSFVAGTMEGGYRIAFEKFERWSPYGTPKKIAEFLSPYVDEGCRTFNIIGLGASDDAVIEAVASVRELLRAEHPELATPEPAGTAR